MKHSIHGKEILSFDPQITCTENNVIQYLQRFSLVLMLRRIADIDESLVGNLGLTYVGKIPVNSSILITAADYAVRHCNESNIDEIPERDFRLYLRMVFALSSKRTLEKSENPFSAFVSMSNQNFPSQENILSELARAYYIYCLLWKNVDTGIDIEKEIRRVTGLEYLLIVFFTYAYMGTETSYFWPCSAHNLDALAKETNIPLSARAQRQYLDWSSCDASRARGYHGSLMVFQKYPLFKSDYRPNSDRGEVYLKVASRELHRKATIGIYYEMSEAYNAGSGKNRFRDSFGKVFQEYVGVLLREHFSSWEVYPEIEYWDGKEKRLSIDWIVRKGDKAILIEVKQNVLGFKAKTSGKQEDIEKDVHRNIGLAFKQLKETTEEIAGQRPEFEQFSNVTQIETLVVLHDPLYVSKTIVSTCLGSAESQTPQRHHVISICDFEYLCDCQKESESMHDILSYKNIEKKSKDLDFREYLVQMYPEYDRQIPFHADIYDKIFSVMKEINV